MYASFPRLLIVPLTLSTSFNIALSRVDLPEPTCPTIPTKSPCLTCRSLIRNDTSSAGSGSFYSLSLSDVLLIRGSFNVDSEVSTDCFRSSAFLVSFLGLSSLVSGFFSFPFLSYFLGGLASFLPSMLWFSASFVSQRNDAP
jgi:hypothetical protein